MEYHRHLKKRIKEGKAEAEDYFSLAHAYLDAGEYDKALTLYEDMERLALSKLELAGVYYEKGEALQLQNRIAEAISAYIESLDILIVDAESPEAMALKGLSNYNLFLLIEDHDVRNQHAKKALSLLENLLTKHPEYEGTYNALSTVADIWARLGDDKKALGFFKKALEIGKSKADIVWALSGVGSVYSRKKEFGKAIELLREALDTSDDTIATSKIHYDIGKIYFEMNRLSDAEISLRKALEERARDPALRKNMEYEIDILWHLGVIAYDKYENNETLEYFGRVLHLVGQDHFYYANTNLYLGHYYLMIKDYKKAKEHYSLVLSAPLADAESISCANEYLQEISIETDD